VIADNIVAGVAAVVVPVVVTAAYAV